MQKIDVQVIVKIFYKVLLLVIKFETIIIILKY